MHRHLSHGCRATGPTAVRCPRRTVVIVTVLPYPLAIPPRPYALSCLCVPPSSSCLCVLPLSSCMVHVLRRVSIRSLVWCLGSGPADGRGRCWGPLGTACMYDKIENNVLVIEHATSWCKKNSQSHHRRTIALSLCRHTITLPLCHCCSVAEPSLDHHAPLLHRLAKPFFVLENIFICR